MEVVLAALAFEERLAVPHPTLPGLEVLGHVRQEFDRVVGDGTRNPEGVGEAGEEEGVLNVLGLLFNLLKGRMLDHRVIEVLDHRGEPLEVGSGLVVPTVVVAMWH